MSDKRFRGMPGVRVLGPTSIRQLNRTIPAGTETVDLAAEGVIHEGQAIQSLQFINPPAASGTLYVFLEPSGLDGGYTPVEAGDSWSVALHEASEFSVSGSQASHPYDVVAMILDYRT